MKGNTSAATDDIIKRMKEIDRENNFWHTLEDIGFDVRRFSVLDMHSVKHEFLPITSCFHMDAIEMLITTMTVDGNWVRTTNGKPVMTCEKFIEWHIHLVRNMTKEILLKLDTRKI